MLDLLKKVIGIWHKITEVIGAVYFTLFNIVYYLVTMAPIFIVAAVIFLVTPERPYMVYFFLGAVAIVLVLAPIVRFLIVRLRLRKKLRRICAQSGFSITLRRSFFVAFRRASGKVDLTVTTPKNVFEVAFIPSVSRFSAIELSEKLDSYRRVSRLGFSPRKRINRKGQTIDSNEIKKTSNKLKKFVAISMDNSDMKPKSNLVSRRTRQILLLSPVAGEVRHIGENGGYREIENGDGVGNRTIYTGTGFVNMLDRLCRDPE